MIIPWIMVVVSSSSSLLRVIWTVRRQACVNAIDKLENSTSTKLNKSLNLMKPTIITDEINNLWHYWRVVKWMGGEHEYEIMANAVIHLDMGASDTNTIQNNIMYKWKFIAANGYINLGHDSTKHDLRLIDGTMYREYLHFNRMRQLFSRL